MPKIFSKIIQLMPLCKYIHTDVLINCAICEYEYVYLLEWAQPKLKV